MKTCTSIFINAEVNIFDYDEDRETAIQKARDPMLGGSDAARKLGEEITFTLNEDVSQLISMTPTICIGVMGNSALWRIAIDGSKDIVDKIYDNFAMLTEEADEMF